jgi:hypothetical protein
MVPPTVFCIYLSLDKQYDLMKLKAIAGGSNFRRTGRNDVVASLKENTLQALGKGLCGADRRAYAPCHPLS